MASQKRITKSERRRLHAAGFPAFERTFSRMLLQLKIKGETLGNRGKWHRRKNPRRKEAVEWCERHLEGRFIPDTLFVFERIEDYVLALLKGYFEPVSNATRVD